MIDDDARTGRMSMGTRLRSAATVATTSLRADRRRTIASVVLDIAVGFAGPFLAVGTGLLVDAVLDDTSLFSGVVVVAVAAAVLLGLSVAGDRVRLRLEENVAHHVEVDVMRMVTGLPGIAHHENPAHLHRIDRLLEESWLVGMAVPALILTLEIVARFALTVVLLASVDDRLALLPLGLVPFLWAGVVAEKIRWRALEARAEHGRKADDIFRLVGETASAGELRTSGVADHLIAVHGRARQLTARDERNHRMRGGWRLALGSGLFVAVIGAGVLVVADRAAAGQASAGQLVMVVGLVGQVIGQAGSVSNRLNWINWALTGVRHYVWLVDYDRRHGGHPATAPAPDRLVDGIVFDGVTFAYPGTDGAVLRDMDLRLPAGTVTAVVGDNGAGKTTLIKLLLRMYEPTAGQIVVDGVPLADIDPDEWRDRTAAALQDHTRPEVLLGEAVGMGRVGAMSDEVAVASAAARSGVDAVFEEVPGGPAAQLGLEWPGGTELSGGQWQRLAVGRSAMRDDALLLVLDEPTSALDPTAEQALFDRYVGAGRRADAVTVVISHRLSTVRMADHIVVIDDGAVVEAGTHAELLAAGGRYATLFEMQARAYR